MKGIYIFLVAVSIAGIGCRESYDPKVKDLEQSFLVVEANLNPGPDEATIKLSRTSKLSEGNSIKPQNGAFVTVEGKDNSSRTMVDVGSGKYFSSNLDLIPGNEYRLRIRIGASEYVSEYVKAKITPPIDSIGLEKVDIGARIFVNTSDPTNSTRYYRWEYGETWQIRSYFFSTIILENGHFRPRVFPAEDVSNCWKYDSSTTILLGNSTKLQNDIISKAPLVNIYSGSDKLSVRYSMLLRQYALDQGAYNFYELMKKNTEEIGSLFNPQPSEVRGNITCITDPSEYVLGYVTASTIQSKRVFFDNVVWDFRMSCEPKDFAKNDATIRDFFISGLYLGIDTIAIPPTISGAYPDCVDCRVRLGSTVKPSYW